MDIKKVFLLFAVILVCVQAQAEDLPMVSLADSDQIAYPTRDAAAVAALKPLILAQGDVEYGGAIYQCGDYFYVSGAVTQNRPHGVDYNIGRYKECSIVGIYHTHPSRDDRSEHFSPRDQKTGELLKATPYIGVVASGTIRKWEGANVVVTIITLPLSASR